jgi:hypothetical protein
MRETARRFVGFLLPSLLNAGLALWIVWHAIAMPAGAARVGFGSFVLLYGVGGLAIVLSCASAFLMFAVGGLDVPQRRRWLMLALVNIIIPSVLLVWLLLLR